MANPHDFHTPKSSYSREDLLQSARGGYFGPGNAQLPAPPMLMMDRITAITSDGGQFGKGHADDVCVYTASGLKVGMIAASHGA